VTQAIDHAEIIRLSLKDTECFAQALLSPLETTSALQRAFVRLHKMFRAEWATHRFNWFPRWSLFS